MNKYNPNIHHRRSIRLKGYDYAQAGLYFITMCVQNREYLFGKISGADPRISPNEIEKLGEIRMGERLNSPVEQEMVLNDAGKMIEKWYCELENKFSDIKCHEMVVMPNHFHCIVENTGTVRANLRVCPNTGDILGEHRASPIYRVVQWFKTMSTNEYIRGVKNLGWQPFSGRLWQRNYYEHIVRDAQSYQNISNYIINNPMNWNKDKFHG